MASPWILSTVLALLSLLLLLAALGSDHWLVANSRLVRSYSGLWKVCVNSGCWMFASVPGGGSLAPGLRAVPFAPGLCAMIALAVYTGEFAGAVNVPPGQVTFGWSFGLGWASFPLFLITGELCVTLGSHRPAIPPHPNPPFCSLPFPTAAARPTWRLKGLFSDPPV
uniref:Uncharacterized protein n=1 Tax=Gopherus agassizii TaxID=38772 RepID=A0A452HMT7_9SAUR